MASRAAQTKKQKERLAKKRALKQQKAALYESYKRAGKNKLSKRFRRNQKKLVKDHDHPQGVCGNPGCEKCHGVSFRPYLKKGKPCDMPHRLYLKWQKLTPVQQKEEAEKKHLDYFRGRI